MLCLFCPSNNSSLESYKAPVLEIVCEDDSVEVTKNSLDYNEIPDIKESNTEDTECSEESTAGESQFPVIDKDSLDVAMRTSTPSNHLLEIFLSSPRVEQVLSWISPTASASEETAAAPVQLGDSPVLSSPSLQVETSSSIVEDEDQEDVDPIRLQRMQQELDDILQFAKKQNDFIEDEAIEALGIAANEILANNEMSIGKAILQGSILRVAEEHYFGDANSFVTRYAPTLRSIVRQMKSNSLQDDKYYQGPDFDYVRPLPQQERPKQQRFKKLAQTVAWGSWKSAGWVYKKMIAISPPTTPTASDDSA